MSAKNGQQNGQKGIGAYFKPKPLSNPHVTPAKRRSPARDDNDADTITVGNLKCDGARTPKQPQTPGTAQRFKNIEAATPTKSPAGVPKLGTPLKVPIRSPKPTHATQSFSSVSDLSSIPSSLPSNLFPIKSETEQQSERADARNDRLLSSSAGFSVASLPKSSQQVVHNGQTVAVRGSDEEDEDSDSSLEDLDDLLGRRKEPLTSSSSPPSIDGKEQTYDLQSWIGRPPKKKQDPIIGKDVFSRFRTGEPKYKHALDSLLADHLDSEEIEANVGKLRRRYEVDEQSERVRESGKADNDLDSTLLESVTNGVNDEESVSVSRLLEAVKRTEALNGEKTWSFFAGNPCHGNIHYYCDFPHETAKTDSWEKSLKDPSLRSRAFLSGYTAEYWSRREMSPKLVHWMLSAIVSEPQDNLREMYSQTLCRTLPANISRAIDALEIQRLFSLLGASIEPQEQSLNYLRPNRNTHDPYSTAVLGHLISVVETLSSTLQHFSAQAKSTFASFVCRMALDSTLMSDLGVSLIVEDTISRLLDIPLDEASTTNFLIDLHEELYTSIQDANLQARLLRHILPTSDCSSRFRVRLAHSFLLQAFPSPNDFAEIAIDLKVFTKHLDNPRYDILHNKKIASPADREKNFDYSALTSWAILLDVAVDNGIGLLKKIDSQLPVKTSPSFNVEVDALADKVKAIAASIRDTGASHMKRTEAKGALDVLYFRLIYAVRTKPRPRKVMFGEALAEAEKERGKAFMGRFLGNTN